ncbi:MAG TPA: PLP-dependent aminotransferase family protein [Acidimicrobiales bacterium]
MDVLLEVDLSGGRRRGVEEALRAAIRAGRLATGTALPSTRQLAADLGLARGTVVDAYEQLRIEGYLAARPGGRTIVAAAVPPPAAAPDPARPAPPRFDLRAGAPDLSLFPAGDWVRAVRAVLRDGPADALDYARPRGRAELRVALAAYLARARGVAAEPEQVVICSGADDALAVLARALVAAGRPTVAMEDPCLDFHRAIVAGAGGEVVPAPVDGGGLDVDALAATGAAAVVATPARQAVVGSTMAPARRGALVAWARRTGAVVVEDDYDGELRYDRLPIGAVQGLDPARVAYVGTTSKSLAPGLRLAWLVVPPALAASVDAVLGPHSAVSSLDQLALATLVREHALDRHLRRVRAAYRTRRDRFVATLAAGAPRARVEGVAAGLHALVRWPPAAASEADVLAEAAARGIGVTPVGPMWHGTARFAGVLAAYGRPPAHDARRCFTAFAELMADVTR